MEQRPSFLCLLQSRAADLSPHRNQKEAILFLDRGLQPLTASFLHPLTPWMLQQQPKGGYSVFGPGVTAFDSIIPPPTDTMDAPTGTKRRLFCFWTGGYSL